MIIQILVKLYVIEVFSLIKIIKIRYIYGHIFDMNETILFQRIFYLHYVFKPNIVVTL